MIGSDFASPDFIPRIEIRAANMKIGPMMKIEE